jgi:glycosyltransferase involved in cell wall biosynthesis
MTTEIKDTPPLLEATTSDALGVAIMVKNEKKRIHVTLNSIVDVADYLIVYDTGSTDNTLQIICDFCKENKIKLELIQGEFENFSKSRNVLLDHADNVDVNYILLLDTNDELRNGKRLLNIIPSFTEEAYLLCQQWWSGKTNQYYNVRLIKNRCGWRYSGVVHEWIGKKEKRPVKLDDSVVIYQDRTQDDDKTGKRFHRDKVLLLSEYNNKEKDPRTVFYLAQTYSCLNDHTNAFKYYSERWDMIGFWEERFQSALNCGSYEFRKDNWPEALMWFMRAIETDERVEPLLFIVEHYKKEGKWNLAYTFCQMACALEYPRHQNLFVEKSDYLYKRWHIMGIVAYYASNVVCDERERSLRLENGRIACEKAISEKNMELDKSNLKFYL